ncbi:hypothetical protein [Gorillibacterium massiliense]|uniref:glycan biosynthesis hexose transferase WsfD n=1 Tax=Gorillibacterium massiliense TaxID=1280390 RepID=UPI0004ADF451|nr:hypothetical protein [Gorillibacterium massiliense]
MADDKPNRRFKQGLALLGRYLSPSLAAALGVMSITIIALFVPPYIGMADNGDYFRILYGNGLYFNTPDYDSQYFGYFVKEFGIFQYFNESGAPIFSSQTLIIKLSMWVNELFNGKVFDIRVQGAILTVFYTIAIYLLVEAVTWKVPAKFGYPIAALAVFLFADTGYTAYFNSFFGESIVLLSMLFILAAGLLLYRKRYNDYVMLGLFFAGALLLTTSKQQNAPVGIIIAVMGVFLVWIRRGKRYRAGVALALVMLLLAGVGTYTLIPKEFVNINKYHAMTRGILMGSDDPEETLKSLGIDRQYAILNKSIYYELYTTVDVDSPILERDFYNKYGFGSILTYYAAHPGQAFNMLNLAAKGAFQIRPPAMGNYEKSVGKAFGAQTTFFSGYSLLKAAVAPKTIGFITIWVIVTIGLYVPSFIAAVKARRWRKALRLPLIVMMIMMGLSGIMISIVGAGDADLSKHEFMFTASFDMVTFLLISDAIRKRLWTGDLETDKDGEDASTHGPNPRIGQQANTVANL